MLIVADADAIMGIVDKEDKHYDTCLDIIRHVAIYNGSILYPTTAVSEAFVVFHRKRVEASEKLKEYGIFSTEEYSKWLKQKKDSLKAISTLKTRIQRGHLQLQCTDGVMAEASRIFDPYRSKKNSFYDAIVVAMARAHNADAIFSFDGWYKKCGYRLQLAQELLHDSPIPQ